MNNLGLSSIDWDLLLRGAKRIIFKKNDVLMKEGVESQRIFQLVRGYCRIEKVPPFLSLPPFFSLPLPSLSFSLSSLPPLSSFYLPTSLSFLPLSFSPLSFSPCPLYFPSQPFLPTTPILYYFPTPLSLPPCPFISLPPSPSTGFLFLTIKPSFLSRVEDPFPPPSHAFLF